MAELVEEHRTSFSAMNKTAFVLGYTGETGKALVQELVTSKVFSRVVLIGRREVQFEDEAYKDLVRYAESNKSPASNIKLYIMLCESLSLSYCNCFKLWVLQYLNM